MFIKYPFVAWPPYSACREHARIRAGGERGCEFP